MASSLDINRELFWWLQYRNRGRVTRQPKFAPLPGVIQFGVAYSLGTDSIHRQMPFEMACLVRFGASTREALLAATARGAQVCQLDDQVGTIEAGKKADIISVRGNPLEDMSVMKSVVLIMKGGERFDHLSEV